MLSVILFALAHPYTFASIVGGVTGWGIWRASPSTSRRRAAKLAAKEGSNEPAAR